jgi:malate dehydrogenase
VVEGINMNDYGQAKFAATLVELRAERDAVHELGLVD